MPEALKNRQALLESEERFRYMADMAGEWFWEQDPLGNYTFSSSAVREILGYEAQEIIGHNYLEFLTVTDRQHQASEFSVLSGVKASFRGLLNRYRHKDGREIFTESTGEPILDEEGRVLKWRGVDHNITLRKRYEDELRLRNRAMEAASVGISITDAQDPRHPNIYANPALCKITGYSKEELIGRDLGFLQGMDTDKNILAAIRNALKQGKSWEGLLKNYRKNGTPFWNLLVIAPVHDEEGQLTHFIGIQTDVTERKRAEEEQSELEIARQIQISLLPKAPLRLPHVQVFGACIPASHVGGDYFDYFFIKNRLDITIADVSGHNVGSALMMAEVRSTLKAETRLNGGVESHDAGSILKALNELLFEDLNTAELFITMFYLRYDPLSRLLHYANAGHNCPLLLRQGTSDCILLDGDGLILGVKRSVDFEEKTTMLEPGDRLLLYTDGITETQNTSGEFFGLNRLSEYFMRYRKDPPQAVVDKLLGELCIFSAGAPCSDDVTLVVMHII